MPLTFSHPFRHRRKIRETLNNLILKSPQDWQTGVALPFVRIVGTTVEWDELRFDVRLLQRVPYEGISRMQTSLRRYVFMPLLNAVNNPPAPWIVGSLFRPRVCLQASPRSRRAPRYRNDY